MSLWMGLDAIAGELNSPRTLCEGQSLAEKKELICLTSSSFGVPRNANIGMLCSYFERYVKAAQMAEALEAVLPEKAPPPRVRRAF